MELIAPTAGPYKVVVTLFTRAHAYRLTLPAQQFDKSIVSSRSSFYFAAQTLVTVPDDDSIEAASVDVPAGDPSDDARTCIATHFILPNVLEPLYPGATSPVSEDARRQFSADRAKLLALSATLQTEPFLACAHPYEYMHMTARAEPVYPEISRIQGARGTSVIEVSYNPVGSVVTTRVYRSSGNALLDDAAKSAAQKSTYGPEVFRCEPQVGAYLYVVQF